MRWLFGACGALLIFGCGLTGEPEKTPSNPRAFGPTTKGGGASTSASKKKDRARSSNKSRDGWNTDNPLRGLRFKGAFKSAGTKVQPKYCFGGTDPTTGLRMIMMMYTRLDAPEDGAWVVAHSLDGNFPDTPGDTIVADLSDPTRPEEPGFASSCTDARIEDGGVVTDIHRWDGALTLDCPSIQTTGTVQFEGCVFFDAKDLPAATAAASSTFGNLQTAYKAAMGR